MKTIQLRVSDEEHTTIKIEAAKRGLSIKDYVMARVEQYAPDTDAVRNYYAELNKHK